MNLYQGMKRVVGAALLVSLVACGGGGGSDDGNDDGSSSADKYVGNWVSTCQTEDTGSWAMGSTLRKKSSTQVGASATLYVYATTNCSGSVIHSESLGSTTMTLTGTKVVDGWTVDTYVDSDGYHDIALIVDRKLYMGDYAATVDVQGYPTALDYSFYLVKQ